MIDHEISRAKRQPAVGFLPKEETLLYLLKKGYDRWAAKLAADGLDLSDTLREIVWELVVICSEFVESGTEKPPRDAYRLAADIGRRLTERIERQEAVKLFRDHLLNFIIEETQGYPAALPAVMRFFMAVGDGIWETYAEQLRGSIRQEKRQRLTEQLRVAKRIQQHLLPKFIPDIPGFDFAGRLVPAEEVGGDYWSIKNYPQDGLVTMKLADVTGHGVAAATLVAAVKFISGGFYSGSGTPGEVIERTNHVLVRETPSDILVTMIYGWLYPTTREIRLVNAGHFPVFIARKDGFQDIGPTGPLLGLHESKYGEIKELLDPGDILVFSSDGIVEAGTDRPFGAERLKEVVWENRSKPAASIVDAVLRAVQSFGGAVSDDLSIVVTRALDN